MEKKIKQAADDHKFLLPTFCSYCELAHFKNSVYFSLNFMRARKQAHYGYISLINQREKIIQSVNGSKNFYAVNSQVFALISKASSLWVYFIN